MEDRIDALARKYFDMVAAWNVQHDVRGAIIDDDADVTFRVTMYDDGDRYVNVCASYSGSGASYLSSVGQLI